MKKVWNKIVELVKAFFRNFVKTPLRLMSHPIQGYTEFKQDKVGKLSVAIGMVIIYALLVIIRYNANGTILK